MRFKLRKAFFSLRGNYIVLNEEGEEAFVAIRKLLSFGDKFILRDKHGIEVASVKQKLLTILPRYELTVGTKTWVMRKRFTLFRPAYVIETAGLAPVEITGSFLELEYNLSSNGQEWASVSKRWFSLMDTFGVDIADPANIPLMLSAVLVISLIVHRQHQERESV